MEFPTISITKDTPEKDVKKLFMPPESNECCTYDATIVLEHEVPGLAKHFEMDVEQFKKEFLDEHVRFNTKHYRARQIKEDNRPYGKCVFCTEEEGCALKVQRPLHARIGQNNPHGSQLMSWFHLNHFVNPDDPQSIREWASHVKLHATIPGGELHELIPDKQKLKDILEYKDKAVSTKEVDDVINTSSKTKTS